MDPHVVTVQKSAGYFSGKPGVVFCGTCKRAVGETTLAPLYEALELQVITTRHNLEVLMRALPPGCGEGT